MIESRKTGAYISRLRKERNWTQLQLADRLNVTHQAVSRWEMGDSFPDVATLSQMAELFGTSVDALLNGGALPSATASQRAAVTPGRVIEELAHGHTGTVAQMAKEQPE